ncbi:MAG TPA: GNAT family N-acetyltransferase [Sphingomicrobium sp.]|nr:GNAT family N-acetyltransferase [Sphingomicrobium sp.]
MTLPTPTQRSAPTLETGRLVLRHYTRHDFTAHYAILRDEAVMRQLGAPVSDHEENWRRFVASVGSWDLMGFGGWAVIRKADDVLVGVVSLFNAWRALEPEFGEQPEMGWIFAPQVHGQGIAGEACRAALDWADANLQPTPMWAIISLDNAPSFKLAERLGFERLADSVYRDEPIGVLKRPAR